MDATVEAIQLLDKAKVLQAPEFGVQLSPLTISAARSIIMSLAGRIQAEMQAEKQADQPAQKPEPEKQSQ
jgi:hypothetical protein